MLNEVKHCADSLINLGNELPSRRSPQAREICERLFTKAYDITLETMKNRYGEKFDKEEFCKYVNSKLTHIQ